MHTMISAIELTALLILACFAWLIVALRKRQRTMQGPWLFLLRAFFKTGSFFTVLGQRLGCGCVLRTRQITGPAGSWLSLVCRAGSGICGTTRP